MTLVVSSSQRGKFEIRISKSETNAEFEIQMFKTPYPQVFVLSFLSWSFGFVSNFEFRVSDFGFSLGWSRPERRIGERPTKKPLPDEEKKRRARHTILSLPAGPGGS
jgi:hypothetical protein